MDAVKVHTSHSVEMSPTGLKFWEIILRSWQVELSKSETSQFRSDLVFDRKWCACIIFKEFSDFCVADFPSNVPRNRPDVGNIIPITRLLLPGCFTFCKTCHVIYNKYWYFKNCQLWVLKYTTIHHFQVGPDIKLDLWSHIIYVIIYNFFACRTCYTQTVLFLAATKQLNDWFCLSVCLWHHHRIIMKFSEVVTNDKCDVHAKVQGQRSKVKVTEVTTQLNRFWTVTQVWIHIWWWNYTYSLMLLRTGALLFFKVIRQISRSDGAKNRRIWPRLGVSGL